MAAPWLPLLLGSLFPSLAIAGLRLAPYGGPEAWPVPPANAPLLAASIPDGRVPFPVELMSNYGETHWLSNGRDSVVYKVKDKQGPAEWKALKVLHDGHRWVTAAACKTNKTLSKKALEMRDECQKAQAIHDDEGWQVPPGEEDGQYQVVSCFDDGVTGSLEDPTREHKPLYIAMNYLGHRNLKEWMEVEVADARAKPLVASAALRKMTRQLVLGLQFLSDKRRKRRWVHHNLQPEHFNVEGEWWNGKDPAGERPDTLNLTLVDLGSAISEDTPDAKEWCKVQYRPPEFAGTVEPCGWLEPVHSFDMGTVAITMLALAAPTLGKSRTASVKPYFVEDAIRRGKAGLDEIHTLVGLASCVARKGGGHEPSFSEWLPLCEACLLQEGFYKDARTGLQRKLDYIREATSVRDREEALQELIQCSSATETKSVGLADQLFSEWVEADFDRALMRMLDPDPTHRPTPEELLNEKWLQPDYEPEEKGSLVPYVCQETVETYIEAHTFQHVKFPLAIIVATAAGSAAVALLGFLCNNAFGARSVLFTALVVAICAIGTSTTAMLWLRGGASVLVLLFSFALGPAVVAVGVMRKPQASEAVKSTWAGLLLLSGAFFLLLFSIQRWQAGWVLPFLRYLEKHKNDNEDWKEDFVGRKQHELPVDMETFVYATLVPSATGLCACVLGLWREDARRRESRQPQAARPPSPPPATEMTEVHRHHHHHHHAR